MGQIPPLGGTRRPQGTRRASLPSFGNPVVLLAPQFVPLGAARLVAGFADVVEGEEILVAQARHVPNRQFVRDGSAAS